MMKTRSDFETDKLAHNIRQESRATSAGPRLGPSLKTCSGPCQKELPLSAFPFSTNPNFRQAVCSECQEELARRRADLKAIRGVAPQKVATLEIKREY